MEIAIQLHLNNTKRELDTHHLQHASIELVVEIFANVI